LIAMDGFNGTGPIYTSADGINWDILTHIPYILNIWYSETLESYVVTTFDSIMYTDDLESGDWNDVGLPEDDGSYIDPVAGNGIWVYSKNVRQDFIHVVGSIVASSDIDGTSWSTTWTFETTLSNVVTQPEFVTGMFYVGDVYNSVLLASPNATTWDSMELPDDCVSLFDIQAAGDMLYVGCYTTGDAQYFALQDSVWNPLVNGPEYLEYLNLLTNGIYIALDAVQTTIYASEDGINWETYPGPESEVFYTGITNIQYLNEQYGLLGYCDFWIATMN